MTNREQAIRDVAGAALSGRGCRCRESLLHDYAVSQRERVLELEARESELLRAVSGANETVLDLKERISALEARLKGKEE